MVEVQKVLDKLKFSLFSPEMIRKMSATKIIVPDTYDDDGYPIDGGLVDTRLGVVDPGLRCKTCGGTVKECPGHFGHIDMVRPVVHVEFAKHIYYIIKSTCPSCHKVLGQKAAKDIAELEKVVEKVAEEEAIPVKPVAEAPPAAVEGESVTDSLLKIAKEEKEKIALVAAGKVEAEAKKKKKEKSSRKCNHCGVELPEIKLLKPTTIFRDKDMILPTDIRDWLASINDNDLRSLGFDPLYSRPEWMIMTVLPVPPVNVRPSITLETGERSEDDLTHKLVDVIRINQKLEANINAGAPTADNRGPLGTAPVPRHDLFRQRDGEHPARAPPLGQAAQDPGAAAQGKGRPLPLQPLRKARQLLGPYGHIAGSAHRHGQGRRPAEHSRGAHGADACHRMEP